VAALLLPENKAKLQAILTYHVVAGKVMAVDVVKLSSAKTVFGQDVAVSSQDGKVMVGNANVTKTDIETQNGVIHVIDAVMMPGDIVDVAVGAGSFNTLVSAVKAAGLVETLKGDGPFTVLAPTDAAFAKLPAGTLDELLDPANKEKLQKILTYHVIPGNVMAADVVKLKSAKTVNGQDVTISTSMGNVMIDNAKVVQTDIKALNGVIHVIDAVILPKPEYTSK
jgi:uncharacterized surface protein with fasciclin (FAS1) repeats